jgi:hypothetical protein
LGPKREEVAGGWRRLHNEELHNLYASSIVIKVSRSRRMRWVGHVARVGEMRIHAFGMVETTRKRGVDGRTILEWMLRK